MLLWHRMKRSALIMPTQHQANLDFLTHTPHVTKGTPPATY